jgi:hypothetical protein
MALKMLIFSMALKAKNKFDLAKLLSVLVPNNTDIKLICDDTIDDSNPLDKKSLNYTMINLYSGSPLEVWGKIIMAAEDQGLLLQLLKALLNRYNGNPELSLFYDEVCNGFEKRVEVIAKAIKSKNCVLFIGPELLQCKISSFKIDAFSRYLSLEICKRLKARGVYFDEKLDYSISYIANRFEDIPGVANRELGLEAANVFKNATVIKSTYEKISELHFPLIISTNPDNVLDNLFQLKRIAYTTAFYDRTNQDKSSASLDEKNTIIYKIFGSLQNPYSVLFTDNDRVQFSKNVVRNDPPIPPIVKILLDSKYYLFLGFNFQEWHLKILIDCLGLAKTEERTFALLMENVNESSVEHFEKNYKFYFINENIDKFLDEVINKIKILP